MQTYLFPFLASIIFLIFHLIIYRSLFAHLSDSKITKNIFKILTFLNFIATLIYMFSRHHILFPQWLFFILSISIGIAFIFFIATILYYFFTLFILFLDKNKRKIYSLLLKKTIIVLTLFYIIYGIYNVQTPPILQKVSIPISNLKIPLKIIQLSDIHIGGLIGQKRVKQFVQIANAQNPDIIVLTGDIIDTNLNNAKNALKELANLKSKFGIYYVLGNHEYLYDTNNIIQYLKNIGFNTLINQNTLISIDNDPIINIAGVADLMGNRMGYLQPDFKKALEGIDKKIPTILLSHQPKIIKYLKEKSPDAILTGHTHGGQIFPFSLAVLLEQPYLMGLHQINSNSFLYINQGTGFWGPPMRIGTHSEITIINLVPKNTLH
ncbi:hypothetical protein BKH44_06580 [Helicobacter sp. 13S00477-4]|nr:hypothetical protein BKH44_06580 [Helicobacter sp. 13S00477-4]